MMFFIKSNRTELQNSEIFKHTSSRFQENKIFDEEDILCFMKQNNKTIGFFYYNEAQYKHVFKIFILDVPHIFSILEFKKSIKNFIRDSNKKYISFSLYPNSKDILNDFKRIDASFRYKAESKGIIKLDSQEPGFTFHDQINDYEELSDFFYLSFDDDEDYCKADWDSMIQSFSKTRFAKITYLCRKSNIIVGACIGFNVIPLEKVYLHTIAAHPDYRGKHIGEHLIKLFLNSAQDFSCFLDVLESAKPAMSLYEKIGFTPVKMTTVFCNKENF